MFFCSIISQFSKYAIIEAGTGGEIDAAQLTAGQKDLRRKTHETIRKISDDIGRRNMFNTAVAASMELLNAVNRFDDESEQARAVEREALEAVVLMLSPIVPHICHELWQRLGHASAVIDERWPAVDESALERDLVELVVQVNGKLRGKISVAADADKDAIIEQALADPNAQRFIDGGDVRKTIVVPGRLVNIVV